MEYGTRVEFKNPIPSEDLDQNGNHYPMTILEDNGDRAKVRVDLGWGSLNPTRIVRTNEIKIK